MTNPHTPDLTIALYNRKTVMASLKRQDLRARAARKFKVTPDSAHGRPVAPNRLRQDFTATAPNQKWVGDMSYLATGEGWLYLAVILDLYSQAVIGWAMAEGMQASLVCDALRMVLGRQHFSAGVIVHSDRGRANTPRRPTRRSWPIIVWCAA